MPNNFHDVCGGRIKTSDDDIFLLFLNLHMVLKDSTPGQGCIKPS